jgi:hypothetical protein
MTFTFYGLLLCVFIALKVILLITLIAARTYKRIRYGT